MELNDFTKHREWVVSELEEWEATFEEETPLPGIIDKIRNGDGLTPQETDDLLFHLWQKAHNGLQAE